MEQELFRTIYESIVKRETRYDGVYYTGVRTTRIICRPSCKARTPKAENVKFFLSVNEAVRAGFRPCKRCRPESPGPDGPDAELSAQVNKLIDEQFGGAVTLQSLADQLAVSASHLQRTYKQVTGRSPAEKLNEVRVDAAKRMLEEGGTTAAEIGLAVGFRSPSHFSAWFRRMTGEAPKQYQEKIIQGG